MLAGLALLCAAVAALAPAEHLRTTYSWPPRNLPSTQPASTWYTPLLLARHEPARLSAEVPDELPPPLPGATRPPVVLATARSPATTGGLAVTEVGRHLDVSVGSTVLTRVDLPANAASDCAYSLQLSGGAWSITGGPAHTERNGSVTMPIVDGLYSSLDLRRGTAPTAEVTTTVHGSRSTPAQTVLRVIGVLCALGALVLVSVTGGARGPRRSLGARLRAGAAHVGLVDAVVAIVLLGWWILGPAYFDDGWIVATQKNFAHAGYFSSYYDSFGVTLSLQYWLEWLDHWLYSGSSSLLVLRLPALVCLAATWVLCRWAFGRVARAAPGRAALWTLATMFVVGAFAWGMTLRPEPVVALIVGGVLACTVRFLERGTAA